MTTLFIKSPNGISSFIFASRETKTDSPSSLMCLLTHFNPCLSCIPLIMPSSFQCLTDFMSVPLRTSTIHLPRKIAFLCIIRDQCVTHPNKRRRMTKDPGWKARKWTKNIYPSIDFRGREWVQIRSVWYLLTDWKRKEESLLVFPWSHAKDLSSSRHRGEWNVSHKRKTQAYDVMNRRRDIGTGWHTDRPKEVLLTVRARNPMRRLTASPVIILQSLHLWKARESHWHWHLFEVHFMN